MFNQNINKNEINKYQANIIRLLVLYETSISANKVQLDSKIFKENNDNWKNEWLKIKQRYNI